MPALWALSQMRFTLAVRAGLQPAPSAELAFHCSTFRVAHSSCHGFPEAVRRAAELAAPGEHVLLSPGFASFDMFRNYQDRGDQFETLVHAAVAPPRVIAANLG